MSFSTPEVKNPTKRFYEFKSDEKRFVYYDKELGKNVPVTLPCYLVILDTLHCVTGFNEPSNSGFYSNEVKHLKSEPLTVKTFKGSFNESGLWDDIKSSVKAAGGNYTRSCYCLLVEKEKEPILVNFKFSRSALNALIEFEGKEGFRSNKHLLRINSEFITGKKGKNEYNIPTFKMYDLENPDLIEVATQTDIMLQEFLKDYLKFGE